MRRRIGPDKGVDVTVPNVRPPSRGTHFSPLPDAGGVWFAACGPPEGLYGRESIDIQAVGAGEGRARLALSAPCWDILRRRLCACVPVHGALNALTPQIIRITVDSILGSGKAKLPAKLLRVLPLERCGSEALSRLSGGLGAVMLTAPAAGPVQPWPAGPAGPGPGEPTSRASGTICTATFSICPCLAQE